jgi:branched-chain amino acid transport system substrate-binding protein
MFGSPYASAPIAAIKNHAELLGFDIGPDQDVSLFAIDTKSQIMALQKFKPDIIWHGNTTMSVAATIRDECPGCPDCDGCHPVQIFWPGI